MRCAKFRQMEWTVGPPFRWTVKIPRESETRWSLDFISWDLSRSFPSRHVTHREQITSNPRVPRGRNSLLSFRPSLFSRSLDFIWLLYRNKNPFDSVVLRINTRGGYDEPRENEFSERYKDCDCFLCFPFLFPLFLSLSLSLSLSFCRSVSMHHGEEWVYENNTRNIEVLFSSKCTVDRWYSWETERAIRRFSIERINISPSFPFLLLLLIFF